MASGIRSDSKLRPPVRCRLGSIVLLAILALTGRALANGADLPPEIVLHGFVKPEEGRVHLVVRAPMVLLASFALPKRGPGYLDLANLGDQLQQAAAATGRQIQLREDGEPLVPAALKGRISIPSDRSFQSYSAALGRVEGPPLPVDTDLFWNQGFFDAHLEYPIRSARGHFSVAVNVAPELGRRLKLRLEFLPVDGAAQTYVLPGYLGWIALDPRWYEATWLFIRLGILGAFAFDRFVFLLCLVAPFRQFRNLLAVVLVQAGLQALSSTAVAEGAAPDTPLNAALSSTVVSAAILLLAIGNLASPRLRRRWFITALVGTVGGFDVGHQLADVVQLGGTHSAVAVVSFQVGTVAAQLASMALALGGLRLLMTRALSPTLALVVVSAILGHMGWHWMEDGGHELFHQLGHVGWSALIAIAPWLLPALLIAVLARFLPTGFDGMPIRTLLDALLAKNADRSSTGV